MTKVNMAGWSQEQIDNWQDPMMIGMQQGPKTGIAGIKPGVPPTNPNPVYQNFMDSKFNIPGAGGAAMTEVFYGDDQSQMFGDTHSAGQFQQYLESIGLPINKNPGPSILPIPTPENPGLGNPNFGIKPPTEGIGNLTALPNYDDKFSGYDTKIGGFDNQFKDIVGRLDKLEQGIGTMANTNVPAPSPIQGGVPSVYTGNNSRGY